VQAVASARAQQQREWEAWGLKLLGDIHAHELAKVDQAGIDQGGTEQAGEAYRRALALAIELGMRPSRRPLSLRPRQALSTVEPAEASTRALHDLHHDRSRDGHAVLAGEGSGGV